MINYNKTYVKNMTLVNNNSLKHYHKLMINYNKNRDYS